ncbi:DNA-binding bromodomain-containing protein [Euphorbia peplus]|nr:DNA-binding bromodomain-containing protein [Euphorbia peplus]
MGKMVEKTKTKTKKKKGRPSLLDLQKRTLKEEQQQQQNHHHHQNPILPLPPPPNYNSATPPSLRRSRRRNPASSEEEDDDDEHQDTQSKRREKKLKLVLKLPPNQKLETDSASESNADDDNTSRKRKINAINHGSASEKRDKSVSAAKPANNAQDWGPSTPLPDKKLLLFIIDRLQKKDTHGVFSEPVDADELPDYHEVIADPMDFGTLRKKLSSGAYATLEQFEKDVFLISSNAMQYNAPDTIYFRQARSIHDLATKSFENLRQDSDDNEPEPKVVRRGRPPKNLKKPVGRPSLAQSHSDFSFDATHTSGGEITLWSNNNLRKGSIISDKSNYADLSGQSHGTRIDAHWSADNKFEKNSEATGSMFRGSSFKNGKKQFVIDENRRNTYMQFSDSGREPSVLATFDAERKQLVAVGLLSEHGYARSLARFAANIGTVAWKIASTRIERSLPPGMKFGHGWVGENDIPPQKPLLVSSSSSPGPVSSSQPFYLPENSCNAAATSVAESEEQCHKPEINTRENGMATTQSAAEQQQQQRDLIQIV